MFLSQLKLTNFRMFEHLEFDLPNGATIILGNNGQGKTSLLEAIYLLAISRAFRAENEREVVNWKSIDSTSPTIVDAIVHGVEGRTRVIIGYHLLKKNPITQDLSTDIIHFGVKKEIKVGGVKRNSSGLIGFVTAVLFSAQDINLVLGPPSTRRRFLDILISQSSRQYFQSLQKYQRGLKQRNSILRGIRNGTSQLSELDFWNDLLITEGLILMFRRLEVLTSLGSKASTFLSGLTDNKECLSVVFRPTIKLLDSINNTREEFAKSLHQSIQRDIQTGTTQFGPHRDDFELSVNDSDMRIFSSRGQARSIALALRLAEASHISSPESEPIILLDDILSELDTHRRERILETISAYNQPIITTTNLGDFKESFLKKSTIFRAHQGNITPYEHDTPMEKAPEGFE